MPEDEGQVLQPLRQRTKAYAVRVIRLYSSLPTTTVAQVIGKQLLRSGTSVGANYREGSRARSHAEIIAKFGLCLQELEESAYWLELLVDSGTASQAALTSLLDETTQLIAIFTTTLKRMTRKHDQK